MGKIRIGTFNCENMFARYKFLNNSWEGTHYVDFIRPTVAEGLVTFGPGRDDTPVPTEISRQQRKNTAAVVLANKPDILAVQEVENLPTMRLFNSDFLKHHFAYSVLIEGNDQMRLIDVGLYSNYPFLNIRTHMFETTKFPGNKDESNIFSRDCLEVEVNVDGSIVTFFVNHFKAQDKFTKRGKNPSKDVLKRKIQAERVTEIVEESMKGDKNARYVVLGDLNCPPPSDGGTELSSLYETQALVSVEESTDGDTWTHFFADPKTVSKMDHILISPALAKNNKKAKLIIERGGLSPKCKQYKGERFANVTDETEASDHCGVFLDLDI